MRSIIIKLLLPIGIIVGKIFGVPRINVDRSFVNMNNRLVRTKKGIFKAEQLLILLPRCLQNSKCVQSIVEDIKNCRRCGKCQIRGLAELSEKYSIRMVVATGGESARKAIKENGSLAIVAVACERELSTGIFDIASIPVLAVLNERPHGPCRDTRVNLDNVEEAVRFFLGNG